MCSGFGCIATRDGRILFVEPDGSGDVSHSDILRRAGMEENKSAIFRDFVRVEFPNWTEKSFRWDEYSTLPGWADSEVEERCKKLLLRISPLYAEYRKIKDPAWAEYRKIKDQALAEYRKITDPAFAEYNKIKDQAEAEAEYNKITYPAEAEYRKIKDQAFAEYRKIKDPAFAEYRKIKDPAEAEFIVKIATIIGYLPK